MKIVIIGSGNVATHLGRAFQMAGQNVIQVWSREEENAKTLADSLGAETCVSLSDITPEADLYIIAVKDSFIKEVAKELTLTDQLIVHTSGSSDLDVLNGVSTKTGVFYPLQTFSKGKAVDFRQIPIGVEGNTPEVTQIIRSIGDRLSENVIELNTENRRKIHIAAVFACNFTNHLWAISKELLKDTGLTFDLLKPLIAETAAKIQNNNPIEVQTGPAARNDDEIIQIHQILLQDNPALSDIYEKLTLSIINFNKPT